MKNSTANNPQTNAMTRRRFLQMASVAGGSLALAACATPTTPATGGDAAADSAGDSGAPAAEVTTISWWTGWSSATVQEAVPRIIEDFENNHPDIKIDYELSGGPPGGGDLTEVLLARIAAGNPPDSTTISTTPAQYAARGSLTALDDYMENAEYATPDAFYEGPLNSCRWQGSVYGLPASAGAGCIMYNVEMFEEAGLPTDRESFPTTWQGTKELSAQLTDWNGGQPSQVGFVPWAAPWLKPVWSSLNGGQLFDAEAMQYNIDSPENAELLQFWLGWLNDEFEGDLETLNFYGPFDDAYDPSAFHQGFAAICQDGSWAPSDADIPFQWEVAKFPVGPNGDRSVTGFWPNWFIVPSGASNVEASFTYNEYWCTKGWEIWYTYIMDTPAWVNFPEGVLTTKLVDQVGQERATELHDFFADYLNDAIDMWNSPVENFANDTLEANISEALFGAISPEEALANAQALIQTRLEETIQS